MIVNTGEKGHKTWRIIVGNINSFPSSYCKDQKFKLDTMKDLLVHAHTDIVVISEHNQNIRRLSTRDQPAEQVKRWWPQTTVRTSSLISSSTERYEPGGTMIITNTRATAHTCAQGHDIQDLGRWNYITLRGKREYYTTVVSVYCPAENQETSHRQLYNAVKRRKVQTNAQPVKL